MNYRKHFKKLSFIFLILLFALTNKSMLHAQTNQSVAISNSNKRQQISSTNKFSFILDTYKFRKLALSKKPTTIIFTIKPLENKAAAKDISESKDKSVLCWFDDKTMYVSPYLKGRSVKITNASFLFEDFTFVKKISLHSLDTSDVRDMTSLFSNCTNLKKVTWFTKLNTSNVRNMSFLFNKCTRLKYLNLTNLNTSNVTNMAGLFSYCENLETIDGIETWDTSNVKSMSSMFQCGHSYQGDGKLKNINLSNLNTSKVVDMSDMFYGDGELEYIDVSNWDMSNVRNLDHTFCNNFKLKDLDVSNWNVSKVKDFNATFHTCKSITDLDLSKWNTKSAIYMCQMFEACTSLKSVSMNFNTKRVIGYCEMFNLCSSLEELDISSFNTNPVPDGSCTEGDGTYFRCCTGMTYMFSNCPNLKVIYVGSNWVTDNKDTTAMFTNSGISDVTLKAE